jgi:hypothetical protein
MPTTVLGINRYSVYTAIAVEVTGGNYATKCTSVWFHPIACWPDAAAWQRQALRACAVKIIHTPVHVWLASCHKHWSLLSICFDILFNSMFLCTNCMWGVITQEKSEKKSSWISLYNKVRRTGSGARLEHTLQNSLTTETPRTRDQHLEIVNPRSTFQPI